MRTSKTGTSKTGTRKGGYTMLENFNLDKYAKDPEIQFALQVHFKEDVPDYRKAREILKANNHLYPSIKELIKEIGVGPDANEQAKYEIMEAKDYWNKSSRDDSYELPQSDMEEIKRSVSKKMSELEKQRKYEQEQVQAQQYQSQVQAQKSIRNPRYARPSASKKSSYSSSNRQ